MVTGRPARTIYAGKIRIAAVAERAHEDGMACWGDVTLTAPKRSSLGPNPRVPPVCVSTRLSPGQPRYGQIRSQDGLSALT